MKATIIGAGIGGLTTAIALKKFGIDYEIYEAAAELKPVGAGIVMASNAMQIFQRLGIEKEISAEGLEIINAYGVDQNWKVISGLKVKERVASKYGIGSYAFQRGRLQKVLLSQLDTDKISLNKKLEKIQQNQDKVQLYFTDGSVVETDFVIGADGIKSMVRKSLFGEIPLRYTGQTCWRGMAQFELPQHLTLNSYEMWGKQKGLRFGFVPTANNEVYFFTTYFAPEDGNDHGIDLKAKLKELYKPFGEVPLQIIESTPSENFIRSDIKDFVPIEKWWKGRAVLLGDAAHATTPNLGQGGCQAVEDAYVLAKAVAESENLEKAFASYQSTRYKKAKHVVDMSWRFGEMTNIGNPIMQSLRNGLMRLMPESMAISELDKILKLNY